MLVVSDASPLNVLIADLKAVHEQLRQARFHVSEKILNDSLARHLAFRQAHKKLIADR
ncbi:MAG: hypothetical protein HKL95_06355 [Phycisphaerae bacterium]|nr:hypothetical protein [Phycisphaerae bacterium]